MPLERKQKGDMVWWQDEQYLHVCAWHGKKAETETEALYQEKIACTLQALNGVPRALRTIKHTICEEHAKALMDDYFKQRMKET